MARPFCFAHSCLLFVSIAIVASPTFVRAQRDFGAPSTAPGFAPSRSTFGPGTTGPGVLERPMAVPKPRTDGRVTIEFRDGSRVMGKLKGLSKLTCETQFGEVTIPFEKIAGLRFSDPDDPNAKHADDVTIEFKNGDSLTGQVSIENIEFQSSWGSATVAADQVWSIINASTATAWHWDGRWRLARNDERCGPNTFSPYRSHPRPDPLPMAIPAITPTPAALTPIRPSRGPVPVFEEEPTRESFQPGPTRRY